MASTGWCTHGHGQTWGIMGAITNKRSGRKKSKKCWYKELILGGFRLYSWISWQVRMCKFCKCNWHEALLNWVQLWEYAKEGPDDSPQMRRYHHHPWKKRHITEWNIALPRSSASSFIDGIQAVMRSLIGAPKSVPHVPITLRTSSMQSSNRWFSQSKPQGISRCPLWLPKAKLWAISTLFSSWKRRIQTSWFAGTNNWDGRILLW